VGTRRAEREEFFAAARKKRARDKVLGALPRTPARGIPPETPGPLFLLFYVPERSSPSRVRGGKFFEPHKNFSSAAPTPRALDGCGPFRRSSWEKEKGANAKAHMKGPGYRLPLVGSGGGVKVQVMLYGQVILYVVKRTFHLLIKADILTC